VDIEHPGLVVFVSPYDFFCLVQCLAMPFPIDLAMND
jgi:hypothetical protein